MNRPKVDLAIRPTKAHINHCEALHFCALEQKQLNPMIAMARVDNDPYISDIKDYRKVGYGRKLLQSKGCYFSICTLDKRQMGYPLVLTMYEPMIDMAIELDCLVIGQEHRQGGGYRMLASKTEYKWLSGLSTLEKEIDEQLNIINNHAIVIDDY